MKPLHHARLIRAGYPHGAEKVGCYTAACLQLELTTEEAFGTEFTVNPEGREKFLRALGIGRPGTVPDSESEEDELAAMRAEMEAKKAAPVSE